MKVESQLEVGSETFSCHYYHQGEEMLAAALQLHVLVVQSHIVDLDIFSDPRSAAPSSQLSRTDYISQHLSLTTVRARHHMQILRGDPSVDWTCRGPADHCSCCDREGAFAAKPSNAVAIDPLLNTRCPSRDIAIRSASFPRCLSAATCLCSHP